MNGYSRVLIEKHAEIYRKSTCKKSLIEKKRTDSVQKPCHEDRLANI